MTAPDIIKRLVERFDQHRDAYRAGKYNETQLRNEFLNPFFEALGWDVLNKLGYSEENKHVIHEDSLEIEGAKKAPDYAFKVGKERKFFVEAKKPSVKIETNPEVAFQLKRYVWSAKLPLGILTDFEEFAVYECRSKPKVSDSVKTGRVMLLSYTDYIEKWDEIVSIFSYNAVMTGGFDKFANTAAKKKGTAEVDSAFLAEIEGWREALAKNIALRNKEGIHSEADLNYAVQMTIDRMIFLRICEERGYESENQLQELSKRENIYDELKRLFEKADRRYNSGLFHFKEEKGRGRADTFTTGLEIDDKVLKDILKDLYYPSPYVFALIPADILGQIYEQFLGKVIRLTAGNQAKVEEKPEVRKAGGVYYTPTFIVDTIVINTLGKLLNPTPPLTPPQGKMTPQEAACLKILDPACGSGTFLLGAYQYLLDWYLKWYVEHDPEKWAKGKDALIYQSKDGWKLTTAKKKEILLNNIHGVDIDPQAVEVTKLSLLLKVIEDPGQLSYLDERILPDLGKNIQCGNSLIGSDYFEGQLMVNEEERARVNAFNWKARFPEVFAQGGFDIVVGNPPYVRQESLSQFKDYFQKHYHSYDGVADLYIYFIEKGLSVLREGGLFSIIVSNSFLRATYGKALRTHLTQNSKLIRIVDFGGLAIFENAKDTYVCIPLLSRAKPAEQIEVCKVPSVQDIDLPRFILENSYEIPTTQLTPEAWSLDNVARLALFHKILSCGVPLGDYSKKQICYGIKTGLNEAFVIDTPTKERLISQDPKSAEIIKPLLQGEDIREWHIKYKNRWLIFARRGIDIDSYPAIKAHLMQWKEDLTPKQNKSQKRGRKPGSYKWYEIQDDVAYYQVFDGTKIVFPDIAKNSRFYFDNDGYYLANTAYAIGTKDLYLLGILNSKLFWFAIGNISIPFGIRAGEYRYRLIYQYMEKVPIRPINLADPAEKAQHDKMVSLVERMLALHKSLASTQNPQEADRLTREVESTDRAIDALVYELYRLSEEEIRIVEG